MSFSDWTAYFGKKLIFLLDAPHEIVFFPWFQLKNEILRSDWSKLIWRHQLGYDVIRRKINLTEVSILAGIAFLVVSHEMKIFPWNSLLNCKKWNSEFWLDRLDHVTCVSRLVCITVVALDCIEYIFFSETGL